jgi:hypothetical protein
MRKTYFLLSAVLFSVTGSFAQTTTTTLNYTGAMQTFVVPACIYSIHADMSGAQGGGNASVSAEGGKGGRLETDIPVTPGQTLYIFVGGMGDATGTPGYNGGGSGFGGSFSNPGSGGGGATDIRIGGTTLNDRVAVAGGGGGGTENGGPATGGSGGGLVGGGPSPAANPWGCTPLVEPTGGTQSAGGTGGTSSTCAWNGFDGSFGLGGNSYNNYRCAGGGGGWYGGGGGHNGCGGAGGSSYTNASATNVVHTQGYRNGNGVVILTYAPGPPMPGPIAGATELCTNSSSMYVINPVSGATSYTWTIPSGSFLNSGQGTNQIDVTAGTTPGFITVYASNACGNSATQTLPLMIDPPSVAGTASVNVTGVCVGDPSVSFSVTGEYGSVAWELSNDGGMTWQNFGSGDPFMPGAPNLSDTGTILVHAVVTSGVCPPDISNNVSLIIYPPSNAGTPSVSADTVCEGSSVMLSSAGTSSGTLMWYSYNGSTYTYLGNGNPYMVNNLSAGNHWYVAMLTSGTCTTDTSAMIGVYADSAAVSGTITSTATSGNLCVNDSVTFMANGSFGAIEWMVLDTNLNQWVNFGYGNPLYPGAPSASDVGMYTFITVATNGACPADTSMSYVINVRPLPAVDLGPDTTVCGGIMLDAGNPGSTYVWNPPIPIPAQTNFAGGTGIYSVLVTNVYGCSSSDTIALVAHPLPNLTSTTIAQNIFCLDDTVAPLTGGSPAGGIWSGNGIVGGNSFSPSAAGLGNSFIVYTYTDSIGCSDSIGAVLLVNACTGITENQLTENISVFPNPNNGTFTLLVNADENEMLVELIDVAGKTVYSSSEKDVHAGYRQEINLESVAGGIYMLRISANGEQSMVRIAVQK